MMNIEQVMEIVNLRNFILSYHFSAIFLKLLVVRKIRGYGSLNLNIGSVQIKCTNSIYILDTVNVNMVYVFSISFIFVHVWI